MIKKEMYNLMQNEVEKMKIGVGAMSELLRMFYDSLIQQNFTPDQAILLTSDYMKAVFGKWVRFGNQFPDMKDFMRLATMGE